MNGQPIAAHPIAEADLRRLATEHGGPRPQGVREDAAARTGGAERTARATRS